MSLICPQCSQANPDQSGFCVRCGQRLQSGDQSTNGPSLPTYASSQSSTLAAPPPYSSSPYSSSYSPPIQPQPAPAYSSAPQVYTPYPAQMGTGQGFASIRRAFAGHGTMIMHYSWSLPGKHMQATAVLSAITDLINKRNIAGLNIKSEKLTERGLMMETRDYLTVHRGVSTVFIYVAPAGNDLYISRATTVLPVVSYARVAIFCLLLLTMFIGFLQFGSLSSSVSPYGGLPLLASAGVATLCLAGLSYPLLFFFIVVTIRSFLNWLVEKDFLIYLRPSTLNDFQLDDIALLEHTTDKIVRDSVEQLGLDANLIVPPAQGYQPKRRVRTI